MFKEVQSFEPKIPRDKKASSRITCAFGLDKLYIDPNADCYPCCYAEGRGDLRLGNALEQSIEKIWTSPLATRIRTALRKTADTIPFVKIPVPTEHLEKNKDSELSHKYSDIPARFFLGLMLDGKNFKPQLTLSNKALNRPAD